MQNKEKILVVDDEETLRTLLREIVQELGFECDIASNGLECLDSIKQGKNYDIILMDIQMPKLNGIETLKNLKRLSPDLSVIMVSASRKFENVRIALQEGSYDYIVKPFDINEIEAVVNRAVERTRLIRENRDYQHNLEEKVFQQTQELISLYAESLEAMVLALDLREQETGYHSYRVTEYALILAKAMGLDETELSVIAKGALLHDLGKIGVPDNILLKPGRLNEEEFDIIRQHPALGYKLLKKLKYLDESSKIVHCHHERYDGEGYPNKLSGEDIPLGARIFSVVDTLDAITTNRTYRKALTFDEAINLIANESGRQFDPKVIDAFIKIPKEQWIRVRKLVEKSDSAYLKKLLYGLNKEPTKIN